MRLASEASGSASVMKIFLDKNIIWE